MLDVLGWLWGAIIWPVWLVWFVVTWLVLLLWNNLLIVGVVLGFVAALIGGAFLMRWNDQPEIENLRDHNRSLRERLIELEESESRAVEKAKRLEQELKRTDDDIRKDNRRLRTVIQDGEARIRQIRKDAETRIRHLQHENRLSQATIENLKSQIGLLRSRWRG